VPRDYATREDAEIVVTLPDGWVDASDARRVVAAAVRSKLGVSDHLDGTAKCASRRPGACGVATFEATDDPGRRGAGRGEGAKVVGWTCDTSLPVPVRFGDARWTRSMRCSTSPVSYGST